MKFFKPKDLLFLLFPNLRLLKLSFDCVKCGYKAYKFRKSYKNYKMKFAMKLAIGSGIAFFVVVLFGFVAFPTLIKSKIKKMTALVPKNDIRGMFTKVPFPLDFNIYIFNVTNPMEVQEGGKPNLQEIGPFCYEEWKTKVNITDSEAEDAMYYQAVDTFYPRPDKGCMTGEEMITIIHPLIVGMVNTVMRQKPGAIGLISKAIKSIYKDPTSIYLTAKAKDILFDGVIIDCDVKDFAGKAVCSQLRTEATDLRHVSETELAFSFLAPKNATPSKFFKVHRGKKHNRQLGAIIEFDEKPVMSIWPTDKCNQIKGTDGTIFPPFLQKSDGLVSFSPDLCRSLAAFYVHDDHYDGVPVWAYSATFGDMSKNADEKCYCYSNDTCLKKGLMDLYNCAGVPLYVSFPHFYDSDESYLNAVTGLKPIQEEHEIKILFEHTTGSPVFARKRLQFNMPLEPNEKVPIFQNLPRLVHPLFWIEEGVSLNNTYTGQLKDLFKMMKIVKITKWLLMMATLLTFGVAFILMMQKSGKAEITSVQKVKPTDEKHNNGISKVSNAMEDNGMDKY